MQICTSVLVRSLQSVHPPLFVDVVIAPSAIHIAQAKAALRANVKIAVQDIHTAKVRGIMGGLAWILNSDRCSCKPAYL